MLWNDNFKRTKMTEVSCATRFPVAIDVIRGRVAGFYFKTYAETRPFYIEAIFWNQEINQFFQVLSNLSYYSPIPGYPSPLFFAHHIGKLSRKYADNILTIVHGLLTKRLQQDYKILLEDRFREAL